MLKIRAPTLAKDIYITPELQIIEMPSMTDSERERYFDISENNKNKEGA